jgi:hypothetical protein
MSSRKLVDYIQIKLAKGEDLVKQRKTLADLGWKAEEIDSAISKALKQRKSGKPIGIIERAVLLIKSPYRFFIGIKPERGFRKPIFFLIFYSVILFLALIARWVVNNYKMRPELGIAVALLSPFIIAFGLVIVLIYTFVFSFISHIFLKFFKGKFSFPFTYKACVYSLIPVMLAFLFFSTNVFGLIAIPLLVWTLLLTGYGLAEINEIPIYQGVISAILSYGLVVAVIALCSLILFNNPGLILSLFS